MSDEAAARPDWRARAKRTFEVCWPFLLVPLVLTALFAESKDALGDPGRLGRLLAWNSLLVLFVGLPALLLYDVVRPRLLGEVCRGYRLALFHVGTLSICAFGGAELGMRAIRVFEPDFAIDAARGEIFRVSLVVLAAVVAVTVTHDRLRDRARSLERREEQAHREALRAQLEALQARTDPHFLYNSLNTVAGLIEEDPPLAERMLEKLSDLFRYALEGSRRQQVPLGAELEAVRSYLEVEALRFGERLRYAVEAESGTESLAVPPLVVQPLVENAVLHGVAPRTSGGAVRVTAARRNGVLQITVEDDGPGPGGSPRSGSRLSLRDLEARLALLYGDHAGLDCGPGASGGFRVCVRLPLRLHRGDSEVERT